MWKVMVCWKSLTYTRKHGVHYEVHYTPVTKQTHSFPCVLVTHKYFYGQNRPTRSHVRWKHTITFTDKTDGCALETKILLRTKQTHSFSCALETHKYFTDKVPMCVGNAQILLRTKQTHSFPCALETHKYFYGQNRPTRSHVRWKHTNTFTDKTDPLVLMCAISITHSSKKAKAKGSINVFIYEQKVVRKSRKIYTVYKLK